MTIALEVLARIRGTLSQSGAGGVASLDINEKFLLALAEGTGADQANAVYIDYFSIAASGSQTYDLAGTLKDRLGTTLVFAAAKTILVIADRTNTNNVILGNATNPAALGFGAGTQSWIIKPGGFFFAGDGSAAGWAIGAGATDEVKLANSGAGSVVTGTIVVIGEV
jgi:hypothetical protein